MQHPCGKMAEDHQQRRPTGKNPGREDEDTKIRKEVEFDPPHVEKTTQQRTKKILFWNSQGNETEVG